MRNFVDKSDFYEEETFISSAEGSVQSEDERKCVPPSDFFPDFFLCLVKALDTSKSYRKTPYEPYSINKAHEAGKESEGGTHFLSSSD